MINEFYLQQLQRLRLLDDDFMQKVFEDWECVELLLRVILDREDLHVRSSNVQFKIKNLQGRSLYMDIVAYDGRENQYNIEVQRDTDGAAPERARYHSSLLDANTLEPGTDCRDLPDSYVIFITEHDVLGLGLPIYHIHRTIDEAGIHFHDRSHIIYVNAQVRDDSRLGWLMQDFWATRAADMHYSALAQRVRYFKEDEEGVRTMCKIYEEIREYGREEGRREMQEEMSRNFEEVRQYGREEGRREGRSETAIRLLRGSRLNLDEIAAATQLPLDVIIRLNQEHGGTSKVGLLPRLRRAWNQFRTR